MPALKVTQRGIAIVIFVALLALNFTSLAFAFSVMKEEVVRIVLNVAVRGVVIGSLFVLYLKGWAFSLHLLSVGGSLLAAVALGPEYFRAGFPLGLLVPVLVAAILSNWIGILASGATVLAAVALLRGPRLLFASPETLLAYLACVGAVALVWVMLDRARKEAAAQAAHLEEASRQLKFKSFLLDRVGQAIVAGDREGRVSYLNAAAAELLGREASEVLGGELDLGSGIELDEARLSECEAALAAGRSWSAEIAVKRKDGAAIPCLVNASPLRDDAGEASGWIAIAVDIRERKAAELALAESARRYRAVVSNLPLIVFALDREGRYTLSDGAGLGLMGIEPGRILGASVYDLYRDYSETLEALDTALSGTPVSDEPMIGDHTFDARYTPVFDAEGKVTGVIGVAMDVTERRHAEEEAQRLTRDLERKVEERTAQLRKANRSLETTLAELKDAQARLVLAGKLAVIGQLVAGIAHELNTPLGAIASSADLVESVLSTALPAFVDAACRLPEADRRLLLGLLGNAAAGGVDIDIAAQRERRRALTSAFQETGIADPVQAADGLAPIAALSSAKRAVPLAATAEGQRCLELLSSIVSVLQAAVIQRAAVDRAAYVVRTLCTYAGEEQAGQAVEVDLKAAFRSLLALYSVKTSRGVEISTVFAEDSTVLGRPEDLNQLWIGLLDNAFQAIEYRGRVEVRTEDRGLFVAVTIVDSGPGIPPEAGSRIFEPFFTTKVAGEGKGLGLDIARRVAESHGGSISFESRPGRTAFKVLLPRRPPAPGA